MRTSRSWWRRELSLFGVISGAGQSAIGNSILSLHVHSAARAALAQPSTLAATSPREKSFSGLPLPFRTSWHSVPRRELQPPRTARGCTFALGASIVKLVASALP